MAVTGWETGLRFLAVVMVDGKTSSAGGGSAMDDELRSRVVCARGRSGKRRHVFVPRQKIGDASKKDGTTGRTHPRTQPTY